ncbi:TadE/TadG family type IV pilus assembly protein [Paenibacillus chartarius]|uniref:TadE/TadG family type IV pilus assembly protein n=1 Tax=Paenibacillus chartarius TaxID=747481 RepID=A0ABV6DPV1_9BACL
MSRSSIRQDRGSIVIEASITLPLFVFLLLGVIALMQIAAADLALRSALSETVKTAAANMYPIKLLYAEAKTAVGNGRPGVIWDTVTGRVEQAQGTVQGAEQFVEDFAAYLPEPLVRLVQAEKRYRTAMEEGANDRLEEAKQAIAARIAQEAVTPVLVGFADTKVLKKDRLKVTAVDWPNLENGDQAWLGIEAQYEMKLALPFVSTAVVIKKKAVERCWIGAL